MEEDDGCDRVSSVIMSYGYDAAVADTAAGILHRSRKRDKHSTSGIVEAICRAHDLLNLSYDPRFIERSAERKKKLPSVRLMPEQGKVRIRNTFDYIPIYLKEEYMSFVTVEQEKKMLDMAKMVDEADGLPVLVQNATVAIIRRVLDDENVVYKREEFYAATAKTSTAINTATDYLNELLKELEENA